MRFDILSVFPEMFQTPFGCSLIKKAIDKQLIEIHLHDIRSYTMDKHRTTDDYPYGGGSGMVMKVEPVARALDDIVPKGNNAHVVLMTPQGETFKQKIVEELSRYSQIILICGHYEGVDERIRKHLVDREISIGDYILTGGELPAMVVVDAVSRLVPKVLGNRESALFDSFSTGLLEGPQYTRPQKYRSWGVPDVILSGDHKKINEWRRKTSLKRTLMRRPDLLAKANLSEEDIKILEDED
ncbi:MAG: tRNA (guanosine(37)-N1)-methyltransferase TrmD [Syntrophobacterales bacterium]|nr:tRNA (guanosine(37)-N1)-methyltransferase TrmD [Syntrophobacterales bacterium]